MAARILVLLATLVLILAPPRSGLGAPAQPSPAPAYVPDEVIVKFRDDVDVNPNVFARSFGATVHKSAEHKRDAPHRVYLLKVPAGAVEATVLRLSRHPLVEFAEVNRYYRTTDDGFPNDERFGEQWSLHNTGQDGGTVDADIDALEAWHVANARCNPNEVIGILDTGIDDDHPELAGKTVWHLNYTSTSYTHDDRFGHGVHVAGIAAAATNNLIGVAGIGADCSLANIKVLGDDGGGSAFDIAVGIYACALIARTCNMSFGGPFSSSLIEYYVNVAWSMGAVLVAAAGNANSSARSYPAFYKNVIAVGSTTNRDTRSSFSTYGRTWVDIGAPGGERTISGVILPGEGILSTATNHPSVLWPTGQMYGPLRGTSMAAPHVSGVAGLVWSRPGLCATNACVRSCIERYADRRLTNFFFYGRLNAHGAVRCGAS